MIQTKVARVVSSTELILAAGAEDGVKEGMEFIVYSLGDMVYDPETKEELGRIEIVKARVVAAHVQSKFTTASTKSKVVKRVVNELDQFSWLARFRHEVSETVWEQMDVDETQAVGADRVVRVGDLVRTAATVAGVPRKETAAA